MTTTKTYTLYRIFVVGFVEPQLFVDSRSLEELTSKWIVSRQVLDALEDKYESDYERYSQELEKNIGVEELAVPRPDKVTITEDVLLTFSGDERGVRGGSVLVGTISGIQKMSELVSLPAVPEFVAQVEAQAALEDFSKKPVEEKTKILKELGILNEEGRVRA